MIFVYALGPPKKICSKSECTIEHNISIEKLWHSFRKCSKSNMEELHIVIVNELEADGDIEIHK